VGRASLTLLQTSQPVPIEALLIPLLNALGAYDRAAATRSWVLVLDDLHVIDVPVIHQALAFLIDHMPPQLRLVIATREDPPLPLARWRAAGTLTELRTADLRFTADEALAFLTGCMDLPLSAAEGAALQMRAEGWIAGLRLAALAMRGRSDLGTFVHTFTGSSRYILDYLAEEVFARQPPHLQSFLLQTSILDRMCGPLCDAVLDEGRRTNDEHATPLVVRPSSFVLEELERANVFIMGLDDTRSWYRYHPLFAEAMRDHLHRCAPQMLIAALHLRASIWFEQQGLVSEAIGHALAAQEFERVAHLLEQHADMMLMRGEYITLQRWLDALPLTVVRTYARLALVYAEVFIIVHRLEAAEAYLDDAEQAVRSAERATEILSEVAALRAGIALYRNDLPGTIDLARQALMILPAERAGLRSRTMLWLGLAYFWNGNMHAGSRILAQASRLGIAAGDLLTALAAMCNEAAVQYVQAQLHLSDNTYRRALQLARERGIEDLPMVGLAHAYLAEVLYEWNDLASATEHLQQAIVLAERGQTPRLLMLSHLTLALLEQARGDSAAALRAIDKAEQIAREYRLPQVYLDRLIEVHIRLRLMLGDVAAAAQLIHTSGAGIDDDLDYMHEHQHIALARTLIAQGDSRQALALLARLLRAAQVGGRIKHVIEILVLQALAFQARGATEQALTALEQALVFAQPEGSIRTIVDSGAPMAALLRLAYTRNVSRAFVARLLAAFPRTENRGLRTEWAGPADSVLSPQSSALVESLTPRELEIVRLLAAGATTGAIARQLILSPGTVKKHVSNILSKLGVHSRIQAIVRARELHLL
jgi:LuxR family maltose regulon positive regulatory protein